MSAKTSETKNINGYSAFWPVVIVFATLAVVQGIYLAGTLRTRDQLSARRANVQQVLPQAQLINQTVENVGKELFALSDGKSNEAAKIIAEFNIQLQQAAAPTNAPVTTTSTPPVVPAAKK
jgi:hypothetical protein